MSEDTAVNTAVTWLDPDWAELRVRQMQTKLHQWAAADPDRRFDDLFNLVHDPATLSLAFARVAGNAGAHTPGVDRMTVRAVRDDVGIEAYLRPPPGLHLLACRELGNAPSPHALEGLESTATRPERLAADRLGGDRTVQPPRLGQRDPLPISGQPHPLALDGSSHHAHGMTSWRAGCGESRTSGSAGGLGKRTPSDRDTAPQVDPTSTGEPQP